MNPHTVVTVKCAACGKVREKANHWFVISAVIQFECMPFEPDSGLSINDLPVCGEACAQREFGKWMERAAVVNQKRVAPVLQRESREVK